MRNNLRYLISKAIRKKHSDKRKDAFKSRIIGKIHNDGFSVVDLSKFDIDLVKSQYRDLRLTPSSFFFCNSLSIREAFGDILPPDDVVSNIVKKFHIDRNFIGKIEHHHKIAIYVVVAVVGINVGLVVKEMEKMGYHIGHRKMLPLIDGMQFEQLQFETTVARLNDETDTIKNRYRYLYHWTPYYNVENILSFGLVPRSGNFSFSYPPRIYLNKEDADVSEISMLGSRLCHSNNSSENDGNYTLLRISLNDLDDNVRLYFDPNSNIGIFCEQKIEPVAIEIFGNARFLRNLPKK